MTIVVSKRFDVEDFSRRKYEKVDELDLGRYNQQEELYRKLFRDHGEGSFIVQDFSGSSISTLFNGQVLDRDPYILITIDDREDEDLEKLGLDEPGWGDATNVRFRKEGV